MATELPASSCKWVRLVMDLSSGSNPLMPIGSSSRSVRGGLPAEQSEPGLQE